jgi:heme exporter protein B
MSNLKILIYQEFSLQNRVYSLVKYIFTFLLFCSLSVGMINSEEMMQEFAIIFSVISVPLAFLGLAPNLIKPDIEDGYCELLLVTCSSGQIITAKYIALCLCFIIGFLLNLPLTYLLFNLNSQILYKIVLCGFLLITISAALILLIASIQSYFRSNTNFLSILVMPLIIPTIILSGIALQTPSSKDIILIMVGINLVIIPSSLYLSAFLIENIYNI